MIMDTQGVGVIEGNMPIYKESVMGISEAAKRHIMKQLSSLYNDPMRAVLREYYANAIDSHRKAGVARPVEVQLPSALHPTFWVRDWGTGMSEDFILKVYNWYGESTKQTEEDSIGHFGFGSKSGFAIASQFSVISYFNGMKYSINFLKGSDGSYRGDIVSALETDEPNGVLVSIPVEQSKVSEFNDTARDFFKYVDPESVLVNNEKPSNIFDHGNFTKMIVDDGVEVWADITQKTNTNYYYNTTKTYKFVMGGITYDISNSQYKNALSRIGVLSLDVHNALFVIPLGSIVIGGNREGVQDSKKTNEMLDKCFRLLVDSLKITIQDKINNLDDYAKVMSVFEESKRIVVDNSNPFTYKNKSVTEIVSLDTPVKTIYKSVGVSLSSSSTKKYSFCGPETIITGVSDADFFVEKEKNSFLPYVKSVAHSVRFITVSSLNDLVDPEEEFKITSNSNKTVITLEEFKQVVKDYRALQREAAAARKAAGIIPGTEKKKKPEVRLAVLDLDKSSLSWINVSELNADDLVYIWSRHMPEPNHWDNSTMRQIITMNLSVFEGEKSGNGYGRLANSLRVLTDKKKVILLAGTRTPSFLEKNIKGVTSILDEIEIKLVVFEKSISAETIKKLETASHDFTVRLRNVIPTEYVSKLDDVEMKEALYNAPITSSQQAVLSQYLEHLEYMKFSKYGTWELRSRFKYQKGGDSGIDFRVKYPLIEHIARFSQASPKALDHMVKYVNSTYRDDLISAQNTATLKTTKG